MDDMLSWRWYTAVTGGVRTHDLVVTNLVLYHTATAYFYTVWRVDMSVLGSGMVNALVSINVVTLHQAWLVLGWVTVCGWVNHFGIYM